jgi:hypothetical protein
MAKDVVSVRLSRGDHEDLKRWAESRGDKEATIAAYLIRRGIEAARERGEFTRPDNEIAGLLIGFLNCLLDTHDHDGYSLAEIGSILGRASGDRDLIELIDRLQSSPRAERVEHGQ